MIRNAAFYLYPSVEAAKKGENFGGTGFLIGEPSKKHGKYGRAHIYAVTNWHVAVQGSPVIRFNTQSGPPDIFDIDVTDWFFDGKHDIAVLPINVAPNKHAVTVLHSQMLVTRENLAAAQIGPGDDVFMVGRFMDHDGGQRNRPALRFGNIAMDPTPIMQSNKVSVDAYCIDLHSRSGYSGSPVFVYRTPQSDLDLPPPKRDSVLGLATPSETSTFFMVLGIHFAQFPETWEVSTSGKLLHQSENAQSPLLTGTHYIQGLSGMTCVLPAWAIREVLDMPKLKKMREETEENSEANFRRDGYPPLSEDNRWTQDVPVSEAAAPPANGENPKHREDFTRLVNAAARKQEPEG
ncbi:S1 family peptidase [Bradyrhizobium sp.]|uniref:S1 family peptidase n=1 Tax=Bradyrhizobium sp. TaxID=376 RepID=UPI003C54C015